MDIIWNISLICPWNCSFCCTDAVFIRKQENNIYIQEAYLKNKMMEDISSIQGNSISLVLKHHIKPNMYDYALQNRQNRGLELSYEDKIKVVDNLPENSKIDFAGGDPLVCYENYLLIKYASEKIGKDNVSVTTTGIGLSRYKVDDICEFIGKLEFTYDEDELYQKNRPHKYNFSNLNVIKKFAFNKVLLRAQIPIHSGNIKNNIIEKIYKNLSESHVDEILLMRVFPVGRGIVEDTLMLTESDYLYVYYTYKELEILYKKPKIKLQCALKNILPYKRKENPCDLIRKSYGINSKGMLLLSAWANGKNGMALDENFIIGNISEQHFSKLISGSLVDEYKKRLDENFGHCKVFSFIYSDRKIKDMFLNNDPLYKNKKIKVYISHSSNMNYKEILYNPINNSNLINKIDIILPHDISETQYQTKELFKRGCDLVIADITFPSTGQGIELGWANIYKIPIICIYKKGARYSSAIKTVCSDFFEYNDSSDIIECISKRLEIMNLSSEK